MQVPKERMWITTGGVPDSLKPCVLAHFVPDSLSLDKPHYLCSPTPRPPLN
jgi:hypothetical protein